MAESWPRVILAVHQVKHMNFDYSPAHRPIQPWIAASERPAPEPGAQRGALHYREFAPPPGLEGIVFAVWTLAGDSGAEDSLRYHVVPDACSDFVFDRQAGEGFVFGTVAEARTVEMSGRVSLVGVRLQPHLLPAYTGIPTSGFRDVEPSFHDASLGAMNDVFASRAGDEDAGFGPREAASLAEAVSRQLCTERVNIRAQWLTAALLAGGGSVDRAVHSTGLSARQLQRIAQQELGLTPKRLGRILRLQQTLPKVLDGVDSLAHIAGDQGYVDQAHMTREFSTLTGYTPGFWRSRRMSD